MKKLLCVTLALLLLAAVPMTANAGTGSWVLPSNSILRFLGAGTTAASWTETPEMRASLAACAMADVAGTGDYFAYCADAVDNGTVYVARGTNFAVIFFFGYNGCLMLQFTPSTMQLEPALGKSILPSSAIALLQDGVNSGAFQQYWKVEKDDFMLQFNNALYIAELLGWND